MKQQFKKICLMNLWSKIWSTNWSNTLHCLGKHFLDTELRQLKTAVLVDRNHKKFPIKADFKGVSLSTSIQNHVKVQFDKNPIEAFLL